ncbi:MAG TPA: hypothetical protein VLH13_04075 [Methanomassiliicoccales archaeon]|nr:hypothetical protein [Methanomassiliicoccales archaeon]
MHRRRYRDRSLRPVVSMFLLGLFFVLGFSPGSIMFEVAVEAMGQYLQYAAYLALIIMAYFVYDNVYCPLRQISNAYRSGQVLGILAMVFAFLAGALVFVDWNGLLLLAISIVLWKVAVR